MLNMPRDLLRRLSNDENESLRQNNVVRKYLALIIVLLLVGLERLAFYAVNGDLVYFLNGVQGWNGNFAIIMDFFFVGIYALMSVVGGWIADRYAGKYKTLAFALIFYLIGYGLITWIGYGYRDEKTADKGNFRLTCFGNKVKMKETDINKVQGVSNYFSSPCIVQLSIALLLISIGAGAVRANIAPFGADQLREASQTETRVFFNWLYWSINIGALLAIFGVSFLQIYQGFFYGFLVPLIGLVCCSVIFFAGYRVLVRTGASTSSPSYVFTVLLSALHSRRQYQRLPRIANDESLYGSTGQSNMEASNEPPAHFLDWASTQYNGKFDHKDVSDVKRLLRVLLLFALLVPWWLVYDQMNTTFLTQGLHMKIFNTMTKSRNSVTCKDSNMSWIPPPWLSLFDVAILIVLIPFLDRVVYPALDRRGWKLAPVTRITYGMGFGVMAMVVAGILEYFRLKNYKAMHEKGEYMNQCFGVGNVQGNMTYNVADLNIAYQTPQYLLIGCSEAFTSVAGMELAYMQAPKRWRTMVMGWYYFSQGIGSFLGSGLLALITKVQWLSNDDQGSINCDKCKLHYYFYLLAIILLLDMLLLMLVKLYVNFRPPIQQPDARPEPRPLAQQRVPNMSQQVFESTRRIQEADAVNSTRRIDRLPSTQSGETSRRIVAAPIQHREETGRTSSRRIGARTPLVGGGSEERTGLSRRISGLHTPPVEAHS